MQQKQGSAHRVVRLIKLEPPLQQACLKRSNLSEQEANRRPCLLAQRPAAHAQHADQLTRVSETRTPLPCWLMVGPVVGATGRAMTR